MNRASIFFVCLEKKNLFINVKVGAYVSVTCMSVASLLFFDIGHVNCTYMYNFYIHVHDMYASPGAKNGLFCVFDDLKFVFSTVKYVSLLTPPSL